MKAIVGAMLGVASIASVVGYAYLKPPAVPTAPIQAVAIQQPMSAAAASTDAQRFEIQSTESQARFVINEVLQGTPKTVVGTTDQVAGQIALDLEDADAAQLGTILINARTLATDSTQRDRAVQNIILQSGSYEYITFTPTDLVGLPTTMRDGETTSVQIVGDLTIRDVTHQVTFDATVMPTEAGRLDGSASTTIRYSDWGIRIPQVPSVASVADEVRLELDFAARSA